MQKPIRRQEDFVSKFYIRLKVKDSPGVLATISKILGDHGVSIASLVQEKGNHEDAALIMVTHRVKEGEFLKAKEELMNSNVVYGIENIIRVEDD
jgi:homoserine dehydrogenase